MGFWKEKPSCDEIRELDMVDYLSSIGYEPTKIKGHDYWYVSPFRDERTASFKINRKRNRFYDFGEGRGGNLIDFGTRYYNCTISDFLQSFAGSLSFQRPVISGRQTMAEEPKIIILDNRPITAPALLGYLQSRKIPLSIAAQYCTDIRYQIATKTYFAIGFKNDKGGYEIRNKYFKGSSSPKSITTIIKGFDRLSVFEGFFNFLSFLALPVNSAETNSDFLILNSLSFFEQARLFMESYPSVDLYLDNNEAGSKYCSLALSMSNCYCDRSGLYKNYEDLNDLLCGITVLVPKNEQLNPKPPS
jgi:hypothetical protein